MMQLENSMVRRDVRPWEWDRYDCEPEDEDEEADDYEDADE